MANKDDKEKFYNIIKIAGAGSFIPLVLLSGPVSGYLLADYLISKFSFSYHTLYICMLVGLAASVLEVVRIIKFIMVVDKR